MTKRARDAAGSIDAGTRLLRALKPVLAASAAGDLTLEDGERIQLSVDDVALHTCGELAGSGRLHITTLRLVWLAAVKAGSSAPPTGYALPYPAIVMHAVCRDAAAFPQPCIYAHVDVAAAESYASGEAVGRGGGGSEEEEDEGMGGTEELRLVPSSPSSLGPVFDAMAACSELHVEAGEGEGEEGMEGMAGLGGGWFTSGEGEGELSEEGRAALDRMAGGGQFEDAD